MKRKSAFNEVYLHACLTDSLSSHAGADNHRRRSFRLMTNGLDENALLRQAYDRMRKAPRHGEDAQNRHSDIQPEWVMRIIANPYDRFEEKDPSGEKVTIIVGRVPESRQWIKLVFTEDPETGLFLTAYNDRRLERRYGGRPWQSQ